MSYQLKDLPITLLAYALGAFCVTLIYERTYMWQDAPILAFAMITVAVPLIQNYAAQMIRTYSKRAVLVLSLSANLGLIGGVVYDGMPVEKYCSIGERC